MVEQAPQTLDSVFHALADATRRKLLHDLTRAEQTVGDLARPHAMSLAAVSKHLQVLERAGLVERRRRGQCQLLRLKPGSLKAAQDWLAFYETFWSTRLDALKTMFETQPAQASTPASPEESHG